jgi:hypothetical protein
MFEPMVWNPSAGEIFKADAKNPKARTEIDINLPFKSSVFIVVPRTSIDKTNPFAFIKGRDNVDVVSLDNWQVLPLQDNILPISIWKDISTHKICPAGQSMDSKNLYFEFDAELCNCQILIPDFFEDETIYINNKKLNTALSAGKIIFDAKYLAYDVSSVIENGKNQIQLSVCKLSNLEKMEYRPVYLCGNFKIDITAKKLSLTDYREWYHFKSCIANDTMIRISKNERKLCLGDWSKQGYPFYSGKVQYTTSFNLKQNQNVILSVEKLYGCVTVEVNGCRAGAISWPPYELDISKVIKSGDNTLIITVENTSANILEEYPEKSGIENVKLFLIRD